MERRSYISVILPLKLEWTPCYHTDDTVESGDRVRVAFAGKEYIAVVCETGISPDIDEKKVKPVIAVEQGMEKIRKEEIELWKQMSQYYLCTIGEVYKAAYPVGKVNLEEARATARQKVAERREKVLSAVDLRIARLQERLQRKGEAAAKAKEGTKTKAKCAADIDKIQKEIRQAEEARLTVIASIDAARQGMTVRFGSDCTDRIILSSHQEQALRSITEGFNERKPVLLHGVTGSGKTEIYMKLATGVLAKGKNILYLVPEIALSRQLEDRLAQQFGDRLLTFHSGESAASRRNSAEIIRNMTPAMGGYIALCTRSGIFLPHHDLGLIIVDEEHDVSYKQDSPAPRYNGRDTALMLSRIHDCNIILGSATPSLEEIYNAATGRHRLVTLSERYHGSGNADIEIIDTRAESRKNGMTGNFSRKLTDRIKATLKNGEQTLILRSRRAWSTSMQCRECGEIQKCPHCNVSLSYHRTDGQMKCHYCGHSLPYTGKCGRCSGPLTSLGAGTQKIEEEAAALFPDARIARLDSDTAQNKTYETRIIKEFGRGDIDILIGTQIITKGFDFERLGLVAVIAADTLLGIQDFRADEKAIHLLEQFRGRCGRRGRQGHFVIQTSQPGHPIYRNLMEASHDSLYLRLLAERKDFDFPPYTRIIELTVRDTYKDRAEKMADRLSAVLGNLNMTGPYVPVIDKIADLHIRKIRLSMKKDRNLVSCKEYLRRAIAEFEKSHRYEGHIVIDVDPA